LVESIILKSLGLTIESPENVDFNFLQEVRVFIKTDGVKEEELAFAENLENTDSRTLELESNGAELTDYITKDSYSLRITAITDEAITESIDIKVASVFEVDAKIAGL